MSRKDKPFFGSVFALACLLLSCNNMVVQSLAAGSKYKAEWIDLSKQKQFPSIVPPRSGHVSFTNHEGDLYVFGGYVEEQQDSSKEEAPVRYVKNDLWKWNAEKMGWFQQDVGRDDLPNARLASACAVIQGKPTLFGGWDPQTPGTGGIILEEVCQLLLDGNKQQWKLLDEVKLPDGPSSRHAAIAINDERVLIHTHRCTDHVIIFEQNDKQETGNFYKQPTTGDAPSPRGLHAATLLCPNKLLVTCGAAQDGTMSNEVFVLDLDSFEWTKVDIASKDKPTPRASPCVCTVQDGTVVLFGGAKRVEEGGLKGCSDTWLLTFDDLDSCSSGQWKLLADHGPPGRNAATMNRIPVPPSISGDGHFFLLQGGWEPFQTTFNDNYVLRLYRE